LPQGVTYSPRNPEWNKEMSMTRFAILLAPLAFATAAAAQVTLPDVPDTDGNGNWSLAELQAVWSDLTEEAFTAMDTSADGAIDSAELQAALDSGALAAPATSG
jgi:hypothetical protein